MLFGRPSLIMHRKCLDHKYFEILRNQSNPNNFLWSGENSLEMDQNGNNPWHPNLSGKNPLGNAEKSIKMCHNDYQCGNPLWMPRNRSKRVIMASRDRLRKSVKLDIVRDAKQIIKLCCKNFFRLWESVRRESVRNVKKPANSSHMLIENLFKYQNRCVGIDCCESTRHVPANCL